MVRRFLLTSCTKYKAPTAFETNEILFKQLVYRLMDDGRLAKAIENYDSNYSNGYYRYFVLITFKDGTDYADKHPRDGWKMAVKDIEKYMKKHKYIYEFHPEISSNGRLHCHGFVCCKSSDYDTHEAELRLVKNYLRRKFGLNTWNRSLSYKTSYKVSDVTKMMKREYTATFSEGYKYMWKESEKYPFLKPVANIKMN